MGNIFRFSATTTSASFVLRKHYFSLLYHYEQVYFFKLQGPVFTPTGKLLFLSLLFLSFSLFNGCIVP